MDDIYLRLMKFTADGVYRYTLDDGLVLFANEGMVRILELDCKPADIVGARLRDLLVYTEAEGTIRRALLTRGELHGFLYHFKTLRGRDKWVIHDAFIVQEHAQGSRCVEAVVKDVTDLESARHAAQQEKERLAVTLQSIGDGVIAADAQGRITLMNRVAAQLTGWPASEALGKPLPEVFQIINEETRAPCENPIEKVFRTNVVVGLANHTVLVSRDGSELPIADSGAPIRASTGEVLGAVLVFRDVSAERLLDDELTRIRKLEAVGLLAGGIAHDFNNILTGILGNVSMALTCVAHGDHLAAELLREAEKAALRARGLTQQLLTFARGGTLVRHAASLPEILRDSATFALRGTASRCDFRFEPDLWPVEVDAGQISMAVQNLVINADQSMPAGGIVTVGAENVTVDSADRLPLRPGRYVRVSVSDTGIGIPEAHLSRIFDPYFTTKQRGSGLGLTTTLSIIKKHEGHIAVTSRIGAGTTFHFYLRAMEGAADAPACPPPSPTPVRRANILVMDDEEYIRHLLSKALLQAGHSAQTVADGAAAVAAYRKAAEEGKPFDVVILDLTIPGGMGGMETVHQLKAIDANVKAIATSGYSTDPVIADCKAYGFRAAVAKPYLPSNLLRLVYAVLAGE